MVREHMAAYSETLEGEEKEFWLAFSNMPTIEKLRDLKTGKIGKLTAFSGGSKLRKRVCICWLVGVVQHGPNAKADGPRESTVMGR